jgi:hypothetical protein
VTGLRRMTGNGVRGMAMTRVCCMPLVRCQAVPGVGRMPGARCMQMLGIARRCTICRASRCGRPALHPKREGTTCRSSPYRNANSSGWHSYTVRMRLGESDQFADVPKPRVQHGEAHRPFVPASPGAFLLLATLPSIARPSALCPPTCSRVYNFGRLPCRARP